MAETASLVAKVTSVGITQAAQQLERLYQTAAKAETGVLKLAAAAATMNAAAGNLAALKDSANALRNTLSDTVKSATEAQKQLQSLRRGADIATNGISNLKNRTDTLNTSMRNVSTRSWALSQSFQNATQRSRVLNTGLQNLNTANRVLANGFDRSNASIQNSGYRIDRYGSAMANGARNSNTFSKSVQNVENVVKSFMALGTIIYLTRLGDAWTILTNKLELAKTGFETLSDVQNRVFDISQRTRTGLEATSALYARLQRALDYTGISGQELGRVVETLSKAMIVSGATTTEANSAMLQFSQAMASGVLRGDEFRAIAEQAPRVTGILSKSLNMTIGELRRFAYSGQLSAEIVMDALKEAAQEIDAEFARTMPTFSQKVEMANNNLIRFFGESAKGRAILGTMGDAVLKLSENLSTIADVLFVIGTVALARYVNSLGAGAIASAKASDAEYKRAVAIRTVNQAMQAGLVTNAQQITSLGNMISAGRKGVQQQIAAANAQKGYAAQLRSQAAQQLVVARNNVRLNATTANVIALENAKRQALTLSTQALQINAQATRQLAIANMALNNGLGTLARTASLARAGFSLMGGPLGVIMLAATAVAYHSNKIKENERLLKEYAESIDTTRLSLKEMTIAQYEAANATALENIPKFKEKIKDLGQEVDIAKDRLSGYTKMVNAYEAAVKKVGEEKAGKLQFYGNGVAPEKGINVLAKYGEALSSLKNKQAEVEETTKSLNDAQKLYEETNNTTNFAVDKLTESFTKLVNSMLVINNVRLNDEAIQNIAKEEAELNKQLDVQMLKMQANEEAANNLTIIQKVLGDQYTELAPLAIKAAQGQITLANATNQAEQSMASLMTTINNLNYANAIEKARQASDEFAQIVKQNNREMMTAEQQLNDVAKEGYAKTIETGLKAGAGQAKIMLELYKQHITTTNKVIESENKKYEAIQKTAGQLLSSKGALNSYNETIKQINQSVKDGGLSSAEAAQARAEAEEKYQKSLNKSVGASNAATNKWINNYEKVVAAGANALDSLKIQESSELRKMLESANKGGGSQEEIEQARLSIMQKYADLRQELINKYDPEQEITSQFKESLDTVTALHAEGYFNDKQYYDAKLQLERDYLAQKAELAANNVINLENSVRGEFDPLQEQANEYQMRLAMLESYQNTELAQTEWYAIQRNELYRQMLQAQAQAENATVLNYMQSASMMAEGLLDVLRASGDESSATFKALFAISKAFAISQAMLNLSSAISQAMADPTALTPAQKFANMAAIAAAGGSLVSTIASATMSGMAHDGIDNIPKEGTWLLDKGERVLSPRQNSDLTTFLKNPSSGEGGSSGEVVINQYITVSGSGDKDLVMAMKKAAADGAKQGYDMVTNDFANRGPARRMLNV